MRATISEIAGGSALPRPPPLVKGLGTKRLGKGRVNAAEVRSTTHLAHPFIIERISFHLRSLSHNIYHRTSEDLHEN